MDEVTHPSRDAGDIRFPHADGVVAAARGQGVAVAVEGYGADESVWSASVARISHVPQVGCSVGSRAVDDGAP
jgi:hypothetical protein